VLLAGGKKANVDIHKVIRKRIRHEGDGASVVGDVNAVMAANVGGKPSRTTTKVSSRQRIVQRSGKRSEEPGKPNREE
jgi:hypothetical protein